MTGSDDVGGPEKSEFGSTVGLHKRHYRMRAHSNPLNDGHFPILPMCPEEMDWHVPAQSSLTMEPSGQPPLPLFPDGRPTPATASECWVDVGCGYGGLLCELAPRHPEVVCVGLEIRDKVLAFCLARVRKLREDSKGATHENLAFMRTNAMKYLPNYFGRGQVDKIFFCYPDPHFKARKWRQRIISTALLAEYAYVLKQGSGKAYIVTDVEDLYDWMHDKLSLHPLFEKVSDAEIAKDAVVPYLRDRTDEADKVVRKGHSKFHAVFRRIQNPPTGSCCGDPPTITFATSS